MTILLTGATGTVGSAILDRMAGTSHEVRALSRDISRLPLRDNVIPVQGDLSDPDSIEAALDSVTTLFLLNAVAPDEAAQAMMTVNLARSVGVKGLIYLSVSHVSRFTDAPHYASKHLVERLLINTGFPATVLRANYYMQNDRVARDALAQGVFPQPIGDIGLAMVDVRDIADVAVVEIMRREQSESPLPPVNIEVCGPEVLNAADIATIWSRVLGSQVTPGPDNLDVFERSLKHEMPAWMAHDLRRMFEGFQRDGMIPPPGAADALAALIGHPLRRYEDFAREMRTTWQSSEVNLR